MYVFRIWNRYGKEEQRKLKGSKNKIMHDN